MIIIPIRQMRKLRLREAKQLVQATMRISKGRVRI